MLLQDIHVLFIGEAFGDRRSTLFSTPGCPWPAPTLVFPEGTHGWGCLAAESPAPGEAEAFCEASAHCEVSDGKVYIMVAIAFMSVLTWGGGIWAPWRRPLMMEVASPGSGRLAAWWECGGSQHDLVEGVV